MANDARIFNPKTGKYEALKDPELKKEHEAQAAGKPAPGDMTEDQIRRLDPAYAGPVVTANDAGDPAGGADGKTEK